MSGLIIRYRRFNYMLTRRREIFKDIFIQSRAQSTSHFKGTNLDLNIEISAHWGSF